MGRKAEMDTKCMCDLRHLVDLSSAEVWVEISEHMDEYSRPIIGMDVLCNLFKWIKENSPGLKFYKLEMRVFNSLLEKLEKNRDDIIELDRYIQEASDRLKEVKGYNQTDLTKVGIARKSFAITLEELINFYKGLEILEEEFEVINESTFILWSIGSYYKNIYTLKQMLERRLVHALINR
jgi:hypothetical protein